MDVKDTLKFMTAARLGEIGALLSGYAEGLSAMGCDEVVANIKCAKTSLAAAESNLCIDLVLSETKKEG